MTGRNCNRRSGVWLLALVLLSVFGDYLAHPAPEPEALGLSYSDTGDTDISALLKRLRQLEEREREVNEQKREVMEEKMLIRAMLEAKERDQRVPQVVQRELSDVRDEEPERLPVPSRRISYMALCHFKICNMGRKRQSLSELRAKSISLNHWLPFNSRAMMILQPRP